MSDSSPSLQQETRREDLSSREFTLRKYEARMGLLKVVLGTALVGMAGVLVPAAVQFWNSHYENQRKNLELRLSQQTSQQQYVKDFLSTALAQDIELRIRFAEYFSTVSDKTYKDDWKEYLKILSDKRKEIRTDINALEDAVLTLKAKDEKSTADQILQAKKERTLEWLYKELGYVQANRSIVPSASEKALTRTTKGRASPNSEGFLVFVSRTRTERRAGKGYSRTVGEYYVTFGGQKIPGLEGTTIESRGPGDNSSASGRRIEAGSYPLFATGGIRYTTLDYSLDSNVSLRPWPAVGLEDTGERAGILIHPAAGYLMSIGTINLSKPLAGPDADIEFPDSRERVVALIDAMKEKLGNKFPSINNMRIPDAWIIIKGEPPEPPAN